MVILTGIYHGDLSYQERHTVQNQFMENFIPVIVATSAFGMGVNKKTLEQSSISFINKSFKLLTRNW